MLARSDTPQSAINAIGRVCRDCGVRSPSRKISGRCDGCARARQSVTQFVGNLVEKALAAGLLQRQSCAVCGNPVAHAHHEDYGRPLFVTWLCSLHHAQHHSKSGIK